MKAFISDFGILNFGISFDWLMKVSQSKENY